MTRPRTARALAVAVTAVLALSLTACFPGSAEMTERPTIDEVTAQYDALAADLRGIVSAEYPDAVWSEDGEASSALAGEGRRVTSQIWFADAALASDAAARDRVVAQADAAAAKYGFGDFATVEAADDGFSYVAGDQWGGEMHLAGGSVNVTVWYATGSHPD